MKKHFIIIAAMLIGGQYLTAHAEEIAAGPKAVAFLGDKTSMFYGAEINKSLNDCFTVGASIMIGEVETKYTATRTVTIPCPVVEKKATVNCIKPDPCKPTTKTERYTAKRDSETVLAMLHGKYKLTGPLSVKGSAGVASIEGDKSLALSGGVSLDLPVSDKLTAGLTAEYFRLADGVDGAMLSASVQYRF